MNIPPSHNCGLVPKLTHPQLGRPTIYLHPYNLLLLLLRVHVLYCFLQLGIVPDVLRSKLSSKCI
jgi:hypothetical protein